jgi:hypothetical protein
MRETALQEQYHHEGHTNVLANKMREALLNKLAPKEKSIVDRIRSSVKGQPIEETLRRLSKDNTDRVNEEELLIALSKMNSNFYLGDIKDFINILKGHSSKSGDDKISIAETVQLIG